MDKQCFDCYYFSLYYTKGYCMFLRGKCGHCNAHNKTVDKHDGCDKWRYRVYKRKDKRNAVIKALDIALTDINVIKTILTENQEDNR